MDDTAPPDGLPPAAALSAVFDVYETRAEGDQFLYFGEPLADPQTVEQRVWKPFYDRGYEVSLTRRTGEYVLVASPRGSDSGGVPWTNVVFFGLTVLSTLYAGTVWYHVPVSSPLDLLGGWPFALAVMSVLGVHEFGHYALSRYHGVEASLPYFVPFPTFFGTMGAVIRMKGRIPDREALFDIGVAGPLAGLVATVVVTTIGLYLDPVTVPQRVLESPSAVRIEFHYPLLLQGIAAVTGQPLEYADPTLSLNPVVFGGWIGMFVTFLNLLPVGQLDGGHLSRAMFGERAETVGAVVPGGLFALAAGLHYLGGVALDVAGIWLFWGLLTALFAFAGPTRPVDDAPLDARRIAVGVFTFVLGALCFTPVPFELFT
ncbi:MAG: site-2 protease family protein [Haloarculaceae archaeon]